MAEEKVYTLKDLDKISKELVKAVKYCLTTGTLNTADLKNLVYNPLTYSISYGYRLVIKMQYEYMRWTQPEIKVVEDENDKK